MDTGCVRLVRGHTVSAEKSTLRTGTPADTAGPRHSGGRDSRHRSKTDRCRGTDRADRSPSQPVKWTSLVLHNRYQPAAKPGSTHSTGSDMESGQDMAGCCGSSRRICTGIDNDDHLVGSVQPVYYSA